MILALDGSFRGSGVVGLFGLASSPRLVYKEYRSTTPELRSFKGNLVGARDLAKQTEFLSRLYNESVDPPGEFVFEMPPPTSQMSAGLTLLNGMIVDNFMKKGWKVFGCSNVLVKSVLGSRSAPKDASRKLVDAAWSSLSTFKWFTYAPNPVEVTATEAGKAMLASHNLCDAFIILVAYSYHTNMGGVFPWFASRMTKQYTFVEM